MRKDSNCFGPVHYTAGRSYPAWIPSRCRDRCERRLDPLLSFPGSHRSSSLPRHAFSLAVAAAVEAFSCYLHPRQRRLGSWIGRYVVEVGGRIGKREGGKEGKREEGRGGRREGEREGRKRGGGGGGKDRRGGMKEER